MSDEILKRAVALAKSGKNVEALKILKSYLRQNPKDVRGWWAVANITDNPKIKRESLQRVLTLKPDHAKARQMVAVMEKAQQATEQPEWLVAALSEEPVDADSFPPESVGDDVPSDDAFEMFASAKPRKTPQQPDIDEKAYLDNILKKKQTQTMTKPVSSGSDNSGLYLLLGVVAVGAVALVVILLVVTQLLKDDTSSSSSSGAASAGPGSSMTLSKTASNQYLTVNHPAAWQSQTTEFNTIVISTRPISTGDINPYRVITDLELRSTPWAVYSRLEYWWKYYWEIDFGAEDFVALFEAGLTGNDSDYEFISDEELVLISIQSIPGHSRRSYSAEQAVTWVGQFFEGELEDSYLGAVQTIDMQQESIDIGGRPGTFSRIMMAIEYEDWWGDTYQSYSTLYFAAFLDGDVEHLFLLTTQETSAGAWETIARNMVESIHLKDGN